MCRVKAILIGCFLFGAYALVSEMDYQDAVARETFTREHRNWVARNCIPTAPNTRVGRTSITVEVEVYAERFSEQGNYVKVTEARLTYVAIDADGRPRPLPVR